MWYKHFYWSLCRSCVFSTFNKMVKIMIMLLLLLLVVMMMMMMMMAFLRFSRRL